MLIALLISLSMLVLSSPTADAGVLLTLQNSVAVGDMVRVTHAQLHFRWDNTVYDDDYLDNSEAATKLVNLLEAMGPENIDSVSVVAYASPEGVYEHNMMLSRRRAAEFSRVFKDKAAGLGFPVNVRPGGESWDLLVERVKSDSTISEVARKRVLDQIADSSISVATRKWRFMHGSLGATSAEGDVYHWLLINHYRFLRCLDIHIHYKDEIPDQVGDDVGVGDDGDDVDVGDGGGWRGGLAQYLELFAIFVKLNRQDYEKNCNVPGGDAHVCCRLCAGKQAQYRFHGG